MTWMTDFNSTFFLAVGSLTSASFALILSYLFKSKCRRCSCCGLVIERDVNAELQAEEMELNATKNIHTNSSEATPTSSVGAIKRDDQV